MNQRLVLPTALSITLSATCYIATDEDGTDVRSELAVNSNGMLYTSTYNWHSCTSFCTSQK